jgi:hypothetical protein
MGHIMMEDGLVSSFYTYTVKGLLRLAGEITIHSQSQVTLCLY